MGKMLAAEYLAGLIRLTVTDAPRHRSSEGCAPASGLVFMLERIRSEDDMTSPKRCWILALAALCAFSAGVATQVFAQPSEWVELGCQRVSFRVDHDTLRVGRREGRFKAIRVFAHGGDVEMLDLRVIYANGAPDDIPVRAGLRRGDRTRPLDLRGWERAIDRIDMVYRSLPSFRGRDAEVCVEGLAPVAPRRGRW
jgi:hypothetical protein